MSKVAPYVWRHPDGRRIEVYPTSKVFGGKECCESPRGFVGDACDYCGGTVKGQQNRRYQNDEEWYASPGPEWIGCSYNDLPPNENILIQH